MFSKSDKTTYRLPPLCRRNGMLTMNDVDIHQEHLNNYFKSSHCSHKTYYRVQRISIFCYQNTFCSAVLTQSNHPQVSYVAVLGASSSLQSKICFFGVPRK